MKLVTNLYVVPRLRMKRYLFPSPYMFLNTVTGHVEKFVCELKNVGIMKTQKICDRSHT